jgi:predicted permease
LDVLERVFGAIIPVFLIIAVGFLYGRKRRPDMLALNRMTLEVLTPALIFTALTDKSFHIAEQLPLAIGGFLLILLCGAMAIPLAKPLGISRRALMPSMMFMNAGNMGLPMAVLAFGAGALPAFVALWLVCNLLQFTLGVRIVSDTASWRALLRSPLLIVMFLGLVFSIGGWHLPAIVMPGLRMMGDASIALMIFSLGVRLTDVDLRDWRIGVIGGALRPMAGIIAALPLAWLLPLTGEQRGLLLMFGALPPAVVNYLMAEQYQSEPEKVASIVLIGNAMALLFVPIGLWVGLKLG